MENERLKNRLDELQRKYDEKFKKVEKETTDESEEIQDETDGSVGGKFKVEIKMVEQKLSLDLPSITTKSKEIKFHVPEVTVKTKRIVWHEPKIVMRRRKVGEVPEIVCRDVRNSLGFMGQECKTRWKPIYFDVPVTEKVKKEIKIDLPEIKMKLQSFDIPWVEITMIQQDIILHLPSVTFKDVEVEVEKESEELQRKTERKIVRLQSDFEAESKQIISEESSFMFDQEIDKLLEQKKTVQNMFNPIIDDMKSKIKSLKGTGATDEVKNLENQLSDLVEQYKTAINQIGDAIEQLNKQREDLVESI